MNNKLNNKENILIKTDQNNLIYIDPNSVTTNSGDVKMRNVNQEEMVMYVNLEADLIPRTTLILGGEQNTLSSIAKGQFNLLSNGDKKILDTSWTETYVPKSDSTKDKYSDTTGQSFGIESIQIKIIGANFVPNVTIKFIDVRGKTLFDSPENSPYKAFFHLPWPVFYLTIKGFYGKAIRYRLHLVKFNTRFNSTNGNFEVDTTFVGSTYAYLNDIPLKGILNAPYMFAKESDGDTTYNPQTQTYTKKVKKSSKGYQILSSVYDEYKSKGLIDKDFPVKTLREVVTAAGRLDKIIEQSIFDKVVDPLILEAIDKYDKDLQQFLNQVIAWKNVNLTSEQIVVNGQEYNKISPKLKNSKDKLVSSDKKRTDTLESLINKNVETLYSNSAFGKKPMVNNKEDGEKVNKSLTTISLESFNNIEKYITESSTYYVNTDGTNGLIQNIYEVIKKYEEKRKLVEADIEEQMNNIISGRLDKTKGFGFSPTIRNITAVILANADTYIRLMKDVHINAFNVAEQRKPILKYIDSDVPANKKNENIYPWPEIKKKSGNGKIAELTYPGSLEMINTLQSNSSTMWPEVEFVENYLQVSTYKSDPLAEKEIQPEQIEYVFDDKDNATSSFNINSFNKVSNRTPYGTSIFTELLYEIYERAKYTLSFSSFSSDEDKKNSINAIKKLAEIEAENLAFKLRNNPDLLALMKHSITTSPQNVGKSNDDRLFTLLSTMFSTSLYERYPYYQSQLPSVDYIKEIVENDFNIEKSYSYSSNQNDYSLIDKFINTYTPDNYRLNIYPFNSPEYLSYSNKIKLEVSDLKPNNGILTATNNNGVITSNIKNEYWLKKDYRENMFINTLNIDNDRHVNILNTPYFHRQLFSDFISEKKEGKYAGSSYLFLNSLPFIELNEKIYVNEFDQVGTLVSTLFREIGATVNVPYLLVAKWGSIYHRYKKYLTENIDIISGVTTPIDIKLFYDNNYNRTYTGDTWNVNITGNTDFGVYPFYQDVFNQIVNNYLFFEYDINSTSGYTTSITNNSLLYLTGKTSLGNYNTYTFYVDNSKFNTDINKSSYTLIPSIGGKTMMGDERVEIYDPLSKITEYGHIINTANTHQDSFRIIWDDTHENNKVSTSYTGSTKLFPNYDEYHTTISGAYGLNSNYYRKLTDLITTFKPEVLDYFEQIFLEFSSKYIKTELSYPLFNVEYNNFQMLLSDIVSVDKNKINTTNIFESVKLLKNGQIIKLEEITRKIINNDNQLSITLLNPREVNDFVIGSFTEQSEIITNFGEYDNSQLTNETKNLIKLYIGDFIDTGKTGGINYFETFFPENNIALTEENIKQFRQLIYLYTGLKINGDNTDFKTYVINNINPTIDINYYNVKMDGDNTIIETTKFVTIDKRLKIFLDRLIDNISTIKLPTEQRQNTIKRSYNDDMLKLELYNMFKTFNDKWIAGNSIGQRTLMEEFLFLDKANRDIGDELYIDLAKLTDLVKNDNANLFSTFVILLKDSNVDIRPLPSYVNFYGTNFSNKAKIKPSKEVARTLFGTFLDVDYEESSPKIILQYVGPTSKHPNYDDIDKDAKFGNDSFNLSDTHNNPIIIAPDAFRNIDYSKSNRAVAFEVGFGDQNQNMFKSIELDQTSIKNTSESYPVLENLGSSAAGSSTAMVDIGLFDIYRSSSYECTVTSLGNAMIQPTMFFYLKNVPLFRGSYWITEVTHNIKIGNIETTFKGSRIPVQSLPNPKDSFMASYRSLFNKMTNRAKVRNKLSDKNNNSKEKTFILDGISYTYSYLTGKTDSNEKMLETIAGANEYGINFNGSSNEQYVHLIENSKINYGDGKTQWLKTTVINMTDETNTLTDNTHMSLISKSDLFTEEVVWSNVKNTNGKYYSARFKQNPNFILTNLTTTYFYNPVNKVGVTVTTDIKPSENKYNGPINVGPSLSEYGIALSPSLMKQLKIKTGDILYFKMNEVVK